MGDKTFAIRVSDEVRTAFNELAERGEFANKGELLSRLVTLYQADSIKTANSILKPAIEAVETLSTRVLDVLNGAAAAIITEEEKYQEKLDEQQRAFNETIRMLQERITTLETKQGECDARIAQAELDKKKSEDELYALQLRAEELEATIKDKQALIEGYQEKLDAQTQNAAEYKQAAQEAKNMQEENARLKKENAELAERHAADILNVERELQMQSRQQLLDLQNRYQTQLRDEQLLYAEQLGKLLARLGSPEIEAAEPSPSQTKKVSTQKGQTKTSGQTKRQTNKKNTAKQTTTAQLMTETGETEDGDSAAGFC